jgi:activator of HSP90 ATPase
MSQKTISHAPRPNNDFTRRSLMAGGALAFGSAAITRAAIAAPDSGIIPARAIHQEELFAAAPARVYEALLDDKQFASFSGATAQIDRSTGGTFSLFNGVIGGRNIELVPNQRIVQAWRDMPAWPAGLYSVVRFALKPQGAGTLLVLDHTGFPLDEGEAESLVRGWSEHYWAPLRKYLGLKKYGRD